MLEEKAMDDFQIFQSDKLDVYRNLVGMINSYISTLGLRLNNLFSLGRFLSEMTWKHLSGNCDKSWLNYLNAKKKLF